MLSLFIAPILSLFRPQFHHTPSGRDSARKFATLDRLARRLDPASTQFVLVNFPKIHLLPNLMTAGNLICGFCAILQIIHAALAAKAAAAGGLDAGEMAGSPASHYQNAVWFILGAFLFDLLDGRLARLGGQETAFGKEFDSLADVVSFGVAPALLVYQLVLRDFDRLGAMIASLYLLCGALRLARFNATHSGTPKHPPDREFTGFPIPAAAGVIASLTLFILWMDAGKKELGALKYALAVLAVGLSFLMFSRLKYPSFKNLNWKTKRSLPVFLGIIGALFATAMNPEWMPAVIFLAYLLYGIVRPLISRRMRAGIEEALGEEAEPGHDNGSAGGEEPGSLK